MIRNARVTSVALFAVLLTPGTGARAEGLSFTHAHAAGTAGFPWSYTVVPQPGDPITLYGLISDIGPPFSSIAPGGSYQLTFYVEGTCQVTGFWDDFQCQTGGEIAIYQTATLSVYLDPSGGSAEILPDTYRDGELVLQADAWLFNLLKNDPPPTCAPEQPDVVMYVDFTGGSWFESLSGNGEDAAGYLRGEVTGTQDLPLVGNVLNFDGNINVEMPVATKPVTWGRVKSLYR